MWLIAIAALWWVANTVTSIVTKSVMIGEDASTKGATSWMPAFKDLRWLELTMLQHLHAAIALVMWLKVVMGKSIWPDSEHKTEVCVAALGSILATNAAYTLVSSSATRVIKGREPLFTFVLLLVLYRKYEALDLTSVVTMVAGACTFVILDTTFNVWGLAAVIASNIAFPVRNIYLKRLQNTGTWENPFETYAIVSLFGVFLLLLVLFLKFITLELFIIKLEGGMISAVSRFTYNVAFIAVLQSVSPLTHATYAILYCSLNLMCLQKLVTTLKYRATI